MFPKVMLVIQSVLLPNDGVQYDGFSTVTEHMAVYDPFMVAVMMALPGATPVTVAVVPLPITVATLVLLEL